MKAVNDVFNRIRADNLSGSGALLRQLTDGLLGACNRNYPLSKAGKKMLENILINFRRETEDFAVIRHFTDGLLNNVQELTDISFTDIYDYVLSYQRTWSDVQTRLSRFFLKNFPLNGKTVLTHSQSSTVQHIILSSGGTKKLQIIQTESRPVMEGRQQAARFADAGLKVFLITDTGYTPLLKMTDMVIFGADSIWSDVFVNKCGTWAMALLARKHDIPVYVVADSRKFIREPAPPGLITSGNKPPEEILEFAPGRVKPVNHYFEAVSTRTVTAFVFEDHLIPGQEMPLTALTR